MILTNFLKVYRFQSKENNWGNAFYVIITQVIRRSDNKVIDGFKTILDIQETNDWVRDSQSAISLNELNWNQIIDTAKRGQLDMLAQRASIDEFYPLNAETDISNLV